MQHESVYTALTSCLQAGLGSGIHEARAMASITVGVMVSIAVRVMVPQELRGQSPTPHRLHSLLPPQRLGLGLGIGLRARNAMFNGSGWRSMLP